MEIRKLTDPPCALKLQARPCVMALGYFDGIHLGHREVIGTAGAIAAKLGVPLAVMTFFPHPKQVLGTGRVDYLMPMSRKEAVLADMGVDMLYVVEFTRTFARLAPKQFVEKYVAGLGAIRVVTGEDFTYGHKGEGNVRTLAADGGFSFGLTAVPLVAKCGQKVSSTRIREMLRAGDVDGASALLGEHYTTFGKTVVYSRNEKTGLVKSRIAHHPSCMLPADGMYEIAIGVGAAELRGVAAVKGTAERAKRLEIHAGDRGRVLSGDADIVIRWFGRIAADPAGEAATAHERLGT